MHMQIREIKLKVRVVIEQDDEGFMAYCPDLEGVAVEGSTRSDIDVHINDAIAGYVESLLKHNDPIPVGIVEEDRQDAILTFMLMYKKFLQKLLSHKHTQDIREITVPINNNQLAA